MELNSKFFVGFVNLLLAACVQGAYVNEDGDMFISEKELYDAVRPADYSPSFRPRIYATDAVKVSVRVLLHGIQDFNEKNGLLNLRATVETFWNDDYFQWQDKDGYNQTDLLIVPATLLWTPDLVVTNSPDIGKSVLDPSRVKLWVWSSGDVEYAMTGVITVKCKIDITFYPYDFQQCNITLTTNNLPTDQLDLELFNPKLYDESYAINGQNKPFMTKDWTRHPLWEVVGANHFLDPESSGNILNFRLTIQRRPFYYNVNMLTPCAIISVTALIIFVMQVNEVGKFGVAFTTLLSNTMFENMVNSNIPRSSEVVPIFSIYIVCQKIYIAGIIIAGQGLVFFFLAFATRAEKEKGRGPPRRFFRFMEVLGKILLVRHINQYKTAKCNSGDSKPEPGTKVELGPVDQWTYIAMIVNRISMLLYILSLIFTPSIITQYHPEPYVKDSSIKIDDSSDTTGEGYENYQEENYDYYSNYDASGSGSNND